jgi:hypothetical protein
VLVRALVLALVLVAGCSSTFTPLPTFPPSTRGHTATPSTSAPSTTPAPEPLRVVDYTTPPAVTDIGHSWAGPCVVHGALPDPHCTPGSVGPRPRGEVCVAGFQAMERPAGVEKAKTDAIRAYGLQNVDRNTIELDHLVPLSIGGSNDASNLWPQVSDIPGAGFRNKKDAVEASIRAATCPVRGPPRVTLEAAQNAMAHDWTTAKQVLGI